MNRDAEALQWFLCVAEHGDVDATYMVGTIYEQVNAAFMEVANQQKHAAGR